MNSQAYIREIPGAKTAVLMIHGIVGTPEHFAMLYPYVPGGLVDLQHPAGGARRQCGGFCRGDDGAVEAADRGVGRPAAPAV